MKKEIRKNNFKNVSKKIIKKAKGITLISLVITIIILLILAGVTLSLTLGDNGIITQAQNAKQAQEIAAIKEDFQLAILDKELEKGGAGLTQEELEEIAGNYGELQDDGNTIKTEDGYEIKIDEIYKPGGGTSNPGSGASDEEIAALEEKIKELEQTVEDLTNTKTELEGTIEDLNGQLEQAEGDKTALQEQIENLTGQVDSLNKTKEQLEATISDLNTQIADLKAKQATGNATVADVLEGKTFSNGTQVGLTGTIKNNGTLNWSGSNTTYNVPAGYYNGGTLDSRPSYNNGYNAGVTAADNRANPNSTNYQTGYNAGYGAGNSAGYNNGYNAGVAAGRSLKSTTVSVTSSSSKISYTQGNQSTTSQYYVAVTLNFTHQICGLYWSRADVSGGGTEYWMAEAGGQACKMDRTNFILLWSYNGNDWNTKATIYLPVSNASKPYNVIVYYV